MNMLWFTMFSSYIAEESEVTSEKKPHNFGDLLSDAGYPKPGDIPVLNRKIFRGHRVTIREHPYVVSIRRNFAHYLTGTLLTKNLVVTVAHPLLRVPVMELGVVVGENYSDRGSIMNTVILVIIHEHFNEYTLKADIALLRLFENIIFKGSVKPISLVAPHAQLHGSTAFVTGWGRCDNIGTELCLPRSTRYNRDEIMDPMLRSISFTISMPNYYCEGYERSHVNIGSGMLCTGNAREEDLVCPCMAVPGAPLVVGARLAAMASWGFGCGYIYDLPLIYTQVSHYASWILTNIIIQRRIDQSNLTILFKATKAALFTKWFERTRIIEPLLVMEHNKQMTPLAVDRKLAYIPGTVYDVRDFVFGGVFQSEKLSLYEDYKKRLLEIKQMKLGQRPSPVPFLDEKYRGELEDSEMTEAITTAIDNTTSSDVIVRLSLEAAMEDAEVPIEEN